MPTTARHRNRNDTNFFFIVVWFYCSYISAVSAFGFTKQKSPDTVGAGVKIFILLSPSRTTYRLAAGQSNYGKNLFIFQPINTTKAMRANRPTPMRDFSIFVRWRSTSLTTGTGTGTESRRITVSERRRERF